MRWPHSVPRHRGRRAALLTVMASVTAVGAVACTGDTTDNAAPTPRTTAELAWAANLDPVSGVTMVGDTAVVYATTPDGLVLNGLDPATGAIRWTQRAAPLADREGLSIGVLDDGKALAYYRADGRARQARLVVADSTTGAARLESEPRWWTGWPTECDDDRGGVCTTTSVQSDERFWRDRPLRMDVTSGALSVVPNAAATQFELRHVDDADGLFIRQPDTAEGPGQLARWSASDQLWERPLPDVFGAPIEHGVDWDTAPGPDADTRVISVKSADDDRNSTDLSVDWSTALVDLRDGTTRWQAPGTTLRCGDMTLPDPSDGDVLLCRPSGKATDEQDDAQATVTRTSDLAVSVERVDGATGTPRWSTPIGDAPALVAGTEPEQGTARLDDERVLIPTAQGPKVLDLTVGTVREPAAAEQFWCDDHDTYRLPELRYRISSPVTEAARWGVHRRCAADGTSLPSTTTPSAVPVGVPTAQSADDPIEQVRLVSEPDGVRAYRVPPRPDGNQSADPTTGVAASAVPTGSTAPGGKPEPAAPWPTVLREAWSFGDVRPVSPVAMVGGTAVYYGLLHSDLLLVGLDPETGKERWRRDTTTAGLYANAVVAVREIDDKVIALLPPTDPARSVADVAIALIDPATGQDVVTTETRRWRTRPEQCAKDATRICATALVGADGQNGTEQLALDPTDGSISAAPATDNRFDREWSSMVEVRDQPVPTVGRVDGEQLAWSRPLGDIMGAPATFEHRTIWGRAMDMFMLSTEGEAGAPDDAPLDLATQLRSAGFTVADGTTNWQEPGTSNVCRGTLFPSGSVSLPGSEFGQLRCRFTGTLTTDPSTGTTSAGNDLTVTLERFDAVTGKAVWSIPLGNEPALVSDKQGKIPLLDDTRMAIGGKVIDLDVGSTRDREASEVFWCPGPDTFYQSVPYNASDTGTNTRVDRQSSGLAVLCSKDGVELAGADASNAAQAPMPSAVPLAYSTPTDSGLRIVSFRGRVAAYEVPR